MYDNGKQTQKRIEPNPGCREQEPGEKKSANTDRDPTRAQRQAREPKERGTTPREKARRARTIEQYTEEDDMMRGRKNEKVLRQASQP